MRLGAWMLLEGRFRSDLGKPVAMRSIPKSYR